jgi:hypothetical protein
MGVIWGVCRLEGLERRNHFLNLVQAVPHNVIPRMNFFAGVAGTICLAFNSAFFNSRNLL